MMIDKVRCSLALDSSYILHLARDLIAQVQLTGRTKMRSHIQIGSDVLAVGRSANSGLRIQLSAAYSVNIRLESTL